MKFEELNKVLDYISGRYFHHDLERVEISFANTSDGIFIFCFDPRDNSAYKFHYENILHEIEGMDEDEFERKATKGILELEKKLKEQHIAFHEPEDCKVITYLVVDACELGDNFFDYDEEPKPIRFENDKKWLSKYVNEGTVAVTKCNCCGRCGGW